MNGETKKSSSAVVKATAAVSKETTPNDLIGQAVAAGASVEQLEKLMSLQERWEMNQSRKAFYKAMNEFQGNKPEMIKGKKVDFGQGKTKYNYNPLPKIQKAIDPVLSQYGLSYKWKQESAEGKIKITCVVSHVDGYSEETWLEGGHDTSGSKNSLQAIGSTVTYLKRYTLENALGLSSDEDDDAAAISTNRTLEELTAAIEEADSIAGLKKVFEAMTPYEKGLANDVLTLRKKDILNIEADVKLAKQ